jgi:hypothetical protein
MPHNRGTRRKPPYVGLVSYKSHTKWVGTHPSVTAYKQAEQERLIELREEVDLAEGRRILTVLELPRGQQHIQPRQQPRERRIDLARHEVGSPRRIRPRQLLQPHRQREATKAHRQQQTILVARASKPAARLPLRVGQVTRRGSGQDHTVPAERGVIAQRLDRLGPRRDTRDVSSKNQ